MNPLSMGLIVALLMLIGIAGTDSVPQEEKCGDRHCSVDEYCSQYDKQCKSCLPQCNNKPSECIELCKAYIVHKLFVLQKQHEDFRGEIGRLQILVVVSIAVALLASLSTLYLLLRKSDRWKKMRASLSRVFIGKKLKKADSGNPATNNNNNNLQKMQENAELGTVRHNGLKMAMPTISASVAPARLSENGSGNASGSRSGSGSGNGNATPNTTTTNLSTRHPSEDTTLDYAYDNPAMTPSPETVQLRPKRESSF